LAVFRLKQRLDAHASIQIFRRRGFLHATEHDDYNKTSRPLLAGAIFDKLLPRRLLSNQQETHTMLTNISTGLRGKICAVLTISFVCLALNGCGKKLDGVYHAGNGPAVITLKSGKATVDLGGEVRTFDYKVEGNKLTIINAAEGDIVMTINDDGTLTSPFGTFSKSAS
jgi:hypothetical protein